MGLLNVCVRACMRVCARACVCVCAPVCVRVGVGRGTYYRCYMYCLPVSDWEEHGDDSVKRHGEGRGGATSQHAVVQTVENVAQGRQIHVLKQDLHSK
jgi:hypothetical protein